MVIFAEGGTVWAPASSRVRVLSGSATIYMEDGASVDSDVTTVTTVSCPSITYVVGAEPSPGC